MEILDKKFEILYTDNRSIPRIEWSFLHILNAEYNCNKCINFQSYFDEKWLYDRKENH